MCYPVELTNVPCPMCKVFKPTGARCPHIKDICSNRALHPRHDVVHLRNAEVKSFNGCGYCKVPSSPILYLPFLLTLRS
ncbi:hypothetical protein M404DRAFT_993817 [Pisolithus tinctorius Marx 270]|uniref:Uncharacterized protein n=1 Tax=Pisolithus tinctorius Marx 270 TaxID=870435 RepID=A0A0C3PUD7_PISTI|nr:hypothetical protein M404DRAFT_993817 [Pisolithus tinctorius Marx 270]